MARDRMVRWFAELGRADVATAGGKGANLGEMVAAGLPVPPGFVVEAAGYLAAMDEGGVRDEIRLLFADARQRADDLAALHEAGE